MLPIADITRSNFREEVLESRDTVILDFYADGCLPCGRQKEVMEGIARDHLGVKVGRINVEAEPELTRSFGVDCVPMTVVVRGGAVLTSGGGVRKREDVLRMLL